MKRTIIFGIAFMCMTLLSVTSFADYDKIVSADKLPAEIKTFVQKNFPNTTISYATKDIEFLGVVYDVSLADGTEIDFDKKGNWDKINCHKQAVPASLIPSAIAQFVHTNHPDAMITKINKERYGYDIELSNGLDLEFNNKGQLTGIDD